MRTPLVRDLASFLLPAFALGLLAACGGGGDGSAGGTGTLQVRMQDTPVDEADNVFVTIDRVEALRPGPAGDVVEVLASTPAQHDLLTLQHGVSAVLGTGQLPVGAYSGIRLIVGTDSREDLATLPADLLKNYIVVDGTPYPLVVPSGAQTGIKLHHAFTLSASEITVLTFDFDVRKSVHQRGRQGVFNLRPTLRMIDTVVSGTISGTVSTSDASPLPAGTVVSAQVGGVEAGSAVVDTTSGAYVLGPLLAGAYDLVVIAPGFAFASELGVAVTAQQDAPGHDFTLVPAAVGDVTGTVSFTTTLPADVTVSLSWSGFVVAATALDTTTGAYAFLGLPVDGYTVRASDGTSTASGPAVVTDGGTTVVDLTLP